MLYVGTCRFHNKRERLLTFHWESRKKSCPRKIWVWAKEPLLKTLSQPASQETSTNAGGIHNRHFSSETQTAIHSCISFRMKTEMKTEIVSNESEQVNKRPCVPVMPSQFLKRSLHLKKTSYSFGRGKRRQEDHRNPFARDSELLWECSRQGKLLQNCDQVMHANCSVLPGSHPSCE